MKTTNSVSINSSRFSPESLERKNKPFSGLSVKSFMLIFLLTAIFLSAQNLNAQSAGDQKQILSQIVDLPEIQQYFALDVTGSKSIMAVWQNKIVFPPAVTSSEISEVFSFQTSQQISAYKPDSFIVFKVFQVSAELAEIEFDLHYNANDVNNKAKVTVAIKYAKDGGDWQLLDLKLGGQ